MATSQSFQDHLAAAPLSEKIYHVDSPGALAKISATISEETEQKPRHIHLRLLQPLTYWSVLAQNRNPDSRWMKVNDNPRGAPSNSEWIVHENLNKDWRRVWATFPISIDRVTFDLTLDEKVEEEGRVRWVDYSVKDDDGYVIGFDDRGLGLLVATMSTVMYMRSKGTVKMEIAASRESRSAKVISNALEALMTGGKSKSDSKAEKSERWTHR